MIPQTRWTDRTFQFTLPVGAFPCVLERFRGTPPRLDEKIRLLPPRVLTLRIANGWSIQEHAGHLWNLEELGEKRLREFLAGEKLLTAADMENRKTFAALHNERAIGEILSGFRKSRAALVEVLDSLSEDQVAYAAQHPRLNVPMRVIDWVFFMCEHDDHHLARMQELARLLAA
jgi:uncharacterized damage-inducible protein DinB